MIKDNEPVFKVSQVAKHLKMSADRLRTYDEEKLVAPTRENNVRLYSNIDIEWLQNLRQLITKDKLTIFGFKEILRLTYSMSNEDFNKFVKKQHKDSIWPYFAAMRKNPNYDKLKNFYHN